MKYILIVCSLFASIALFVVEDNSILQTQFLIGSIGMFIASRIEHLIEKTKDK